MKKTVTLVFVVCLTITSYGQQLSRLSTNSMTLEEKSFIQSQGFPLTQYKFDSSEINAQLQAGLKEREKGKKLATYGWIAEGVGVLAMLVIPTPTPSFENPNPSGAGKILLGSALILGGGTSVVIGWGKKQKAIKKIENAKYQYSALKN